MNELLRPVYHPALDVGNHFPWSILPTREGNMVLELDLTAATREHFVKHLHELLELHSGGQTLKPLESAEEAWQRRHIRFALPSLHVGSTLELSMQGQPV